MCGHSGVMRFEHQAGAGEAGAEGGHHDRGREGRASISRSSTNITVGALMLP